MLLRQFRALVASLVSRPAPGLPQHNPLAGKITCWPAVPFRRVFVSCKRLCIVLGRTLVFFNIVPLVSFTYDSLVGENSHASCRCNRTPASCLSADSLAVAGQLEASERVSEVGQVSLCVCSCVRVLHSCVISCVRCVCMCTRALRARVAKYAAYTALPFCATEISVSCSAVRAYDSQVIGYLLSQHCYHPFYACAPTLSVHSRLID